MFVCMFPETLAADTGTSEWKEEFDLICAQTEIATSLSKEQLNELISDSDELLTRLAKLKDPWAKIYIRRLEKCREFYRYTIDWQESELKLE